MNGLLQWLLKSFVKWKSTFKALMLHLNLNFNHYIYINVPFTNWSKQNKTKQKKERKPLISKTIKKRFHSWFVAFSIHWQSHKVHWNDFGTNSSISISNYGSQSQLNTNEYYLFCYRYCIDEFQFKCRIYCVVAVLV